MNLLSLLPLGLNLLSAFTGGNKTTNTSESTSTPSISPQMQQALDAVFAKIPGIIGKQYPKYTGPRLAAPTAARAQAAQALGGVGQLVNNQVTDASGYKAKIDEMLARRPTQITVPNLVPTGGPMVGRNGGY